MKDDIRDLKTCSCGVGLTSANSTYNGISHDFGLEFWTCNSCKSTISLRLKEGAVTDENKHVRISSKYHDGKGRCEEETCQQCCEHDFDDLYCLNCGIERDMGELIDAAEYRWGDR
jgi:hypothetical protein